MSLPRFVHTPARLLAVAVAAAVLALWAAPAFAHVSVSATDATQGGFAVLTFRVPTESETASTTRLQVTFPADQPQAFVAVKPHPGWTYSVERRQLAEPLKTDFGDYTEAVSTITWTASGGAIKPGEFDEFQVEAGPLPQAASMTFKAVQTYSDGDVVRWIEPAAASGEEPEHPAPVLALAPATTADAATSTPESAPASGDGSATASPSVTAAPVDVTAGGSADGSSDGNADGSAGALPTVLAGAALVVALGTAGLVLAGRRRP